MYFMIAKIAARYHLANGIAFRQKLAIESLQN